MFKLLCMLGFHEWVYDIAGSRVRDMGNTDCWCDHCKTGMFWADGQWQHEILWSFYRRDPFDFRRPAEEPCPFHPDNPGRFATVEKLLGKDWRDGLRPRAD